MFGPTAPVSAQAAELPDTLVLRFEPETSDLDQAAIRVAVATELRIPLALEGSEHAATLTIGRAASGEVRVSYRPARAELTRSVPVTGKSDVPGLIAHLAGNLVRSEAQELLAALAPAPSAPPAAVPAPTAAASTAPVTQPLPACEPKPCEPLSATLATAPYFDDAWIFSVLAGGVPSGDEQLQLSLQLSRRIGRFELAAGARFGYGRVDAQFYPTDVVGIALARATPRRVSSYQLTLPLSAEYRVLGHDEAYLQLGGYVGYRLAGIMNQSESVTSGSDGDASFGLQATMGFRLAANHGVMLRLVWELAPKTHGVSSSDGYYFVDALAPVAQVGWQIGW
jgi:hypothetical protein